MYAFRTKRAYKMLHKNKIICMECVLKRVHLKFELGEICASIDLNVLWAAIAAKALKRKGQPKY